jgi:hypothetical protein
MKPMTILVLVFAVVTPALAQTPVNQCGQVLNQSGDYVLTTDLGCGCSGINGIGFGGITISASMSISTLPVIRYLRPVRRSWYPVLASSSTGAAICLAETA